MDLVYSAEQNAMIREHVASGSYGKSTVLSTTAEVTNIFPDVKVGEWYSEGIRYCKVNGIMSGYASGANAGKFGLNDLIKRGQIAQMLYRLAGEPLKDVDINTLVSPFPDLQDKEKYCYKAAVWANQNGIVTGYTSGPNAGKFGPDDPIQRQQLAVMLGRYVKNYLHLSTESTETLDGFRDKNDVSNFAKDDTLIQFIVEKGVITGKERTIKEGDTVIDHYFLLDPKATAKRSEAATMFMRFCENVLKM